MFVLSLLALYLCNHLVFIMSWGFELETAKGQDARTAPRGPLQVLASPSHGAERWSGLTKAKEGPECKDTVMSPLSVSQAGFHGQEKQKEPGLPAWLSTAGFGETTLCSENPLLVHRSTTKAHRTAATILSSYFTGTALRQGAGAMTGVTARQRNVTAPSPHLETSASSLNIKSS